LLVFAVFAAVFDVPFDSAADFVPFLTGSGLGGGAIDLLTGGSQYLERVVGLPFSSGIWPR